MEKKASTLEDGGVESGAVNSQDQSFVCSPAVSPLNWNLNPKTQAFAGPCYLLTTACIMP